MRTRHPEHYHKKTPTTKKDPAMVEHPASLPRRNTKPLYEVTITVLGKPLTVAQVLELTDQLVALRDSLRRPTSRSPVRSESTQSDSGLGS